jgi:hypothetical protein
MVWRSSVSGIARNANAAFVKGWNGAAQVKYRPLPMFSYGIWISDELLTTSSFGLTNFNNLMAAGP